tara:strand:- start:144 stop:536 length:393 start_codon:yes stop_codon:yes gene_type:complete
MQQLYMIPAVREHILSSPLEEMLREREEAGKGKEGQGGDDSVRVVAEVKRMFSYLAKSTMQFYDMTSFCKTTGVNTAIQEDAQEYLNGLLDKMEKSLKPLPQKRILDLFSTKTGIETVCQNPKCDYRGDR